MREALAKYVTKQLSAAALPGALELAKRVVADGETTAGRHVFYAAIQKRAAETRVAGETDAMAFARTIEKDEHGRLLYQAMRLAQGSELPPHRADDAGEADAANVFGPVFNSPEEAQLDKLAKDLMNKTPGLSYASAYTQIITMPAYKPLYEAVRNDGLIRQLRGIVPTAG
jgi:hypothetical protein